MAHISRDKAVRGIMIKAVLFDMDGTLIDTEKYFRVCWPMAIKHFGYDISDEQVLKLRSFGRPFVLDYFRDLFGDGFEYKEVKAYRNELMLKKIENEGLQVKKGVVNCLKYLKSTGVKIVIVTASDKERAQLYIKKVGIDSYFSDIISAVDVKQGKPAPDVYLEACKVLNIKPSESVAVEDSPNGVESAYRAGCNVIMIPDQTKPDDRLKKMFIGCLDSMDEFEAFVKEKKLL